jgi:Ni,Fe-hydrogenase III large subunit
LRRRLTSAGQELRRLGRRVFEAPGVRSRFEHTAVLSSDDARALGVVGVAARASGLDIDARRDHPDDAWGAPAIAVAIEHTGDVMARARVRWRECKASIAWLQAALDALPEGAAQAPLGAPRSDALALGVAEGWRGEILHALVSDGRGALRAVNVVDPSVHNWFGLAVAMRGNAISDFPLANKSFDLSYAGHDL